MSSYKDFEPFHAPQGLHHVLSVALPALAAAVIEFDMFEPWPWACWLVALGHGLLISFWAQWKAHTRQSPLIRFWLWLLLQSLMVGELLLVVGPLYWEWGLACLAQGQMTALWQSQLISRARLFYKIEGVPDGEKLEARVHDFQLDADFSSENRRTLLGSLAILTSLVIAVSTSLPRGRTVLGVGLAVGYVFVAAMTASLTGVYRREMESLMYGRRMRWEEKLLPMGLAALLFSGCAGGAWWLTTRVGPLVDWDKVLIGVPPIPVDPGPLLANPPPIDTGFNGGDLFPALTMAFWLEVLRYRNLVNLIDFIVRFVTVALPIAILIWALWPLFRLIGRDNPWTPGMFGLWWKLFLLQCREFWRRFLDLWRASAAPGEEHESLTLSGADLWLKSLAGRLTFRSAFAYPELIAAFVRVMEWARPTIDYRAGETTGGYSARLAQAFPELADDILLVSRLLEQDLFSNHRLGPDERRDFLAAVKKIVVS